MKVVGPRPLLFAYLAGESLGGGARRFSVPTNLSGPMFRGGWLNMVCPGGYKPRNRAKTTRAVREYQGMRRLWRKRLADTTRGGLYGPAGASKRPRSAVYSGPELQKLRREYKHLMF